MKERETKTATHTMNVMQLCEAKDVCTSIGRIGRYTYFYKCHILLIGHEGHPEVIGTMGQLPDGAMTLIETENDAREFTPENPENLALATQTTLSVDDTKGITDILLQRFRLIILHAPPFPDLKSCTYIIHYLFV